MNLSKKKKKSQSYKISLGIGKKKKKKKREIASKRIIRFGNLRKKWWIPYREREVNRGLDRDV